MKHKLTEAAEALWREDYGTFKVAMREYLTWHCKCKCKEYGIDYDELQKGNLVNL